MMYLYYNMCFYTPYECIDGIAILGMIRSAFGDFIELPGPLAQLVERFHGMEEVAGPNPAWSTHRKRKVRDFFLSKKPLN